MAGLANRVPVVTNLGALSEPLWAASTGATVVPCPDPTALAAAAVEVIALPSEGRLALGARGAELYFSEFTLERTIARLRQPGPMSDGPIHR
jgi:glycosyltransferase involved in cell wall biosynthesis